MKKISIIVLSVVLVLSLTTISFASNVSELQSKLQGNKDSISAKEAQVDKIKEEQKGLLQQIDELGRQINELQYEINELNTQIDKCDAEIKVKEEELKEKEEEMERQNDLLKKRMVVMYKNGNVSMIDVLLGSSNITEFLSRYHMMSEIAEFDENLLKKMNEQKEQIEQLKAVLEDKKQEIVEDKEAVQSKSTALAASKNTLAKKNAQLESDKNALNTSIDKLIEESNKLTAQIMQLQGNGAYSGGTMAWPAPGYKTITSPYGMRTHPITGVYKLHTGVDIGAPYGVNIVAANSGKVITATYNTAYGNMIVIDHGGGISTLYAHSSKLLVKVGDYVTRGQTIAYVGSTGYSTGAHLHFEVRINGTTTDPLKYIK